MGRTVFEKERIILQHEIKRKFGLIPVLEEATTTTATAEETIQNATSSETTLASATKGGKSVPTKAPLDFPLLMAMVAPLIGMKKRFSLEFSLFKKTLSLFFLLLFMIPSLIVFALDHWFDIYVPDMMGFRGHDDPVLFLLASPGIAFLLSLPFYFVRQSLYRAWLVWTIVWFALPVWIVVSYDIHSNHFIDPSPFFLAVPYIGGCLVILLLSFILSRIKNNQEQYEAKMMKRLKYLSISLVAIIVVGTILYNIAFYFEKKIRYKRYNFVPTVTQLG